MCRARSIRLFKIARDPVREEGRHERDIFLLDGEGEGPGACHAVCCPLYKNFDYAVEASRDASDEG
jgi:hypothetical protein